MGESDSVTVIIARTAKAGREADFERALHDFVQRSLALPGQQGVHIMRPPPGAGSREYGIVRKFSDRSALERFNASETYQEWLAGVAEFTEGAERREELNGLESWLTLPSSPLRPLPRWKTAIATYVGVVPVTTFLGLFLAPHLKRFNFYLSNAIFNLFVVGSLTWIVMPVVTRILNRWLHPD